jgi:hypothetical protein
MAARLESNLAGNYPIVDWYGNSALLSLLEDSRIKGRRFGFPPPSQPLNRRQSGFLFNRG